MEAVLDSFGRLCSTADLAVLRAEGWDMDIAAHVRRGGRAPGLCGGSQMLGRVIADPLGADGPPGAAAGLGLLDVATELAAEKRVAAVSGAHLASGAPVSGYEIHAGRTEGPDCARPWLRIEGRPEGAVSPCGRIAGAYVHGLFGADAFRAALGAPASGLACGAMPEATLAARAGRRIGSPRRRRPARAGRRGMRSAGIIAVAALLGVAAPAALPGIGAPAAQAQTMASWNAAVASCRQFVAGHLVSIGYPATVEEVSAVPGLRQSDTSLNVTFSVDGPSVKARGSCTLVGIGANWSVVSMTIRPVAP